MTILTRKEKQEISDAAFATTALYDSRTCPIVPGERGGVSLRGNLRFDGNGNRHPRLCRGVRRGRACEHWALKGVNYCQFCGGRRMQRNLHTDLAGRIQGFDMQRLRFYSHRLGPKLQAMVSELLEAPEVDQLRLNEELAFMRTIAGEAVALYSAACELPENNKNKADLTMNAALCMQGALEQVVKTAKTAAEISAMGKDKFSVHALHDVVAQITKMVYVCFDADAEGLQRFDAMISEQLRLPQINAQGTVLTPDADVVGMDDTVPAAPDAELEETQDDAGQ